MMRDTIASCVLVVALAGAGAACTAREATEGVDHEGETHAAEGLGKDEGLVELTPEAAERIRIRVAPVEERALSGTLDTTGRVDFDQDRLAHVSPRVPGRVHRVRAKLGDRVRAGQALAIIDSIELGRAKSDLLRARAQLDLAARTLERERGLLEDRITSEQSVLEARAAHERALAEYQAARRELRLLGLSNGQIDAAGADDPSAALFPLQSPIAGTVVDKHASLGEVVSPETSLFTVADLSRVWIWVDVYERDLARVHLEDDVAVRVDAFPDHTFEGKVAYIRDQVDPDTRTARARLDVANTDEHLRPGMFAAITVVDPHGTGGEEAPRALVVPSGALQRDGDGHVAFVPVGDNRYERRVLTLGRRTGAYAEVLDGLSAGESVVVEGTFILKSEAAKHRMGGGHGH
jgi:cobalt-zinc-cadmium efflux system membrane fusion protein